MYVIYTIYIYYTEWPKNGTALSRETETISCMDEESCLMFFLVILFLFCTFLVNCTYVSSLCHVWCFIELWWTWIHSNRFSSFLSGAGLYSMKVRGHCPKERQMWHRSFDFVRDYSDVQWDYSDVQCDYSGVQWVITMGDFKVGWFQSWCQHQCLVYILYSKHHH
jgi:hypothetical protein